MGLPEKKEKSWSKYKILLLSWLGLALIVLCCASVSVFEKPVHAASRYGTPLRFENPPVELEMGSFQPANPVNGVLPRRHQAPLEKRNPSLPLVVRRDIAPMGVESVGEDRTNEVIEGLLNNQPAIAPVVEVVTVGVDGSNVSNTISGDISDKVKVSPPKNVVRLFYTADLFRKPIKGIVPQWERVVNNVKKKNPFLTMIL